MAEQPTPGTPRRDVGDRLSSMFPAAEPRGGNPVLESLCRDATNVWADLWAQFKPFVTPSGVVMPEMEKGFVPPCGWPEFLETLWILKRYLDAIGRRCAGQT